MPSLPNDIQPEQTPPLVASDAWWAVGATVAVCGVILALFGTRALKGVFLGVDKRSSTSKAMAALWTLAIFFGLAALVAYAVRTRQRIFTAADQLQSEYLLLLGGPFAAAVLAAQIVSAKVKDNLLQKVPETDGGGLTDRLRELIANDNGDLDLVDLQYVTFSLLTLVYFFIRFFQTTTVGPPEVPVIGLPDLPNTLVGLISTAGVVYIGNKAVLRNDPKVSTVTPQEAPPGEEILIRGHNLVPAGAPEGQARGLVIKFGLATVPPAGVREAKPDEVRVQVPAGLGPGRADVEVTTAAQVTLPRQPFTVLPNKAVLGEPLTAANVGQPLRLQAAYALPPSVKPPVRDQAQLPRVAFGATEVTADAVPDEQTLEVTVPAGLQPGDYPVRVIPHGREPSDPRTISVT
jgi:IPT/TIG domain-containing protein